MDLAEKSIWLRLAQIWINELIKTNEFKVPVHLAIGHEAIAVAVDRVMENDDALFLTHRNAHYNLARQGSLKEELNEYRLSKNGLATAKLGSMNLSNLKKGIPYSSSILGNNLPVAGGYAFANKTKNVNAVTFVVTGDGAMEEGSFYESLLLMKSFNLASIVIVENNNWSLATRIQERRTKIDLANLSKGLGIEYVEFEGNDVIKYVRKIEEVRRDVIKQRSPTILEVNVTTLGSWYMKNNQHPDGKFINYHSGAAPEIKKGILNRYPVIEETVSDPLYVLKNHFSSQELNRIADKMLELLKKEFQ